MKKRIWTTILCFVLMFTMLASTVAEGISVPADDASEHHVCDDHCDHCTDPDCDHAHCDHCEDPACGHDHVHEDEPLTVEPAVEPEEEPEPEVKPEEEPEPEVKPEEEPEPEVEPQGEPAEPQGEDECPHENTYEEANWFEEPEYVYIEGSDEHEVRGTMEYTTYCADCGALLDSRQESATKTEPHAFDQTRYDSIRTYEEIENDNRHHLFDYQEWCVTYCICGAESERSLSFGDGGEEDHRYGDDNICDDCGHVNTCTHERTYTNYYWPGSVSYTEIPDDNGYHNVSGIIVTYTACEGCSRRVYDEPTTGTRRERHNYNGDGVCVQCGHRNACMHPNMEFWYDYWGDSCDCTEIPGNNKKHSVSGVLVSLYYCPDCEEEIREYETTTREEEHNYNDEGVCYNCGHVNTCTHENTYQDWYWPHVEYEEIPGDNRNHTEIATVVYYIYCEDCGTIISEDEPVEETYVSGHHYDPDGVCEDCGHVNTCTHPNKEYWYHSWVGSRDYTEIPGDNAMHNVSGMIVEVYGCDDCGQTFRGEPYETTSKEPHSYTDEGVCYECGHVNNCAHTNTYRDWDWDWSKPRTYTEIENDNRDHYVTGYVRYYMYCRDCGTVISREDPVEETRKEMHYYDDNICDRCGHVNTCEHLHIFSHFGYNSDELEYVEIPGDNLYHNATGTFTYYYECRDCGITISRETREETKLWEHDYGDDNICNICGHVNTCTHGKTEEGIRWAGEGRYEQIEGDNRWHLYIEPVEVYQYCVDCGMQIGEGVITERSWEASHEYDKDGICIYCRYENTCAHENTYPTYYWKDISSYEEIPDNNQYHIVNGTIVYCMQCEDCWAYLDEEEPVQGSETEGHWYTNGVCEDCGHVNTCSHENVHLDSWWYKAPVCEEIPGDNLYHNATGTRAYEYYCEDCGEWFGFTTEEESVREVHDYADGVCRDCGHVNSCAHANTRQSCYWVDLEIEEIPGDNRNHAEIGTVVYYIYCEDCGTIISEDEPVEETHVSGHYYDSDGICKYCGHVNTCVHENVWTWSYWQEEGSTFEEIKGDNIYHIRTGYVVYGADCDDCGMSFEADPVLSTGKVTHQYDIETGVCTQCGHVNTCTHDHIQEYGYWSGDVDVEYKDIGNNAKHEATGDRVTYTKCEDCYQQLTEDEVEYKTILEFHEYDENGFCYGCGHERQEFPEFDGTVELNTADVTAAGTMPYVIANGKVHKPRFVVKDAEGNTVDPETYDYWYYHNRDAGVACVVIQFFDGYSGYVYAPFRIYLPATASMSIANVKAGVKMAWKAVDGAGGYAIYRRGYNAKTKKWTKWGRLATTTALNYTDTKAVAGTKYQYAVRPYLGSTYDYVMEESIGGPSDTANYGVTGPKKLMVRIPSVTLKSVTAGSKRMTVKWTTSKLVNGYQIQYATNSTFTKGLKSVKVTSPKTASKVIKSLKKGTTYYVRVRGYKIVSSVTYYSGWTAMKKCKVK